MVIPQKKSILFVSTKVQSKCILQTVSNGKSFTVCYVQH